MNMYGSLTCSTAQSTWVVPSPVLRVAHSAVYPPGARCSARPDTGLQNVLSPTLAVTLKEEPEGGEVEDSGKAGRAVSQGPGHGMEHVHTEMGSP